MRIKLGRTFVRTVNQKSFDMKKFFLLALFSFLFFNTYAQFKFGVRGGFSSQNVNADSIKIFRDNNDTLSLGLADITGGYHFGVFMRIGKKFYVQPEVLFNSNRAEFTFRDLVNADGRSEILKEKYQYLDIPIMLGWKMGAFRVQGGPVGHLFLDNNSDLFDKEGFKKAFDDLTYGYQAGAGLDIWNVSLDVRYEGNFTKFGEFIEVDGHKFNFDDTPSRWIVSVGVSF